MVTLVNRAKMATATTGTGTITLGAAEPGQQTFASAGILNGDTVRYTIEDGTAWEIGTGTYSSTGPTLTRTAIESSAAGAEINLSGAARVYVTVAAGDLQKAADMDQGVATTDSPTFAGATVNGNITVTGTVDGRDVAADGTKLDGIEAGADVTDTTNVTAAGALMDSELTNITAVKALNQGVATTDSPSFAGLAVDTNTLYVDAANNRVGIGTASPTSALTVAGSIDTSGANTGILTASGAAATPTHTFATDTDTGMFRGTTNMLNFATGGVEQLRLNASGAIGIQGGNYGTSGQVLTSQGSAAAPVWGTATGADKVWQSVTRTFSTNYQNTTGYPLDVLIMCATSGGASTGYVWLGPTTGSYVQRMHVSLPNGYGGTFSFTVPTGWYYKLERQTAAYLIYLWSERSA